MMRYQMDSKYKMMDMKDRCAAAKPDMQQLTAKANAENAPIVGLRDQCYERFTHYGIAQRKKCLVRETGFHPWNRASTGVEGSDPLQKLDKFAASGFSLQEFARACTIQRIPGEAGDFYEHKNIEAVNASNGMLAPVAPKGLQQFALTCNHTWQALRAGEAEVACDIASISRNGRVSKAILRERDSNIALAYDEGLETLHIHWMAEVEFPDMIRLIIEADNVPNTVAKQDNVATFMMKCYQAANALKGMLEGPQRCTEVQYWKMVQDRVKRSELARESDVPHYIEFVKEWSGGMSNPFIIEDLARFVKGSPVVREVPAILIGKIASVDLGPAQGARWRCACLKSMVSSSDKYTCGNRSTFFAISDISNMSSIKTKALALTADAHMVRARNVSKPVDDEYEGAAFKLHSLLDKRLVNYVFNRSRDFKSMIDICNDYLENLRFQCKLEVKCPSEWQQTKKEPSAPCHGPALRSAIMPDLKSDAARSGALRAVLAAFSKRGCEVGSHCTHILTKMDYKVMRITAQHVELEGNGAEVDFGANFKRKVENSTFFDVFGKCKQSSEEAEYIYIYIYIMRYNIIHILLHVAHHIMHPLSKQTFLNRYF